MTDDSTGPDTSDAPDAPDGDSIQRRTIGHGPPAGAPQCPACHHSRRHQPGCDLLALRVEDAAVLGYEEALRHARAIAAAAREAPATGAPPQELQCPACHHSRAHHPGCDLAPLAVDDAALLGLEAARVRVRQRGGDRPRDRAAQPAPAPSEPDPSEPAPSDAGPSCAAHSVAGHSVAGPSDATPAEPVPPTPLAGVRDWLRRLLRR
jgi:hypothetical protein